MEKSHEVAQGAQAGYERYTAEQAYVEDAFDYSAAPIGSRDWTLYWKGWQARAALATQPAAIKLPPRQEYKLGQWSFFDNYAAASWNQCLDAVEKLNSVRGAEHE